MDPGPILVRRLPLGVLASVAVHAALGALVYAYDPPPRPEPERPPVAVEIIAVEEPLAVALAAPAEPEPVAAPALVRPPEPPPVAIPPPTPPPNIGSAAEISTDPRPAVEVAPPAPVDPTAPGATPPPRSAWFDLRRGRPTADLRLPPGSRDALDNAPRGTGPVYGVAPTGQLQDAGGGSLRSDQGPFTAKVAPDGSVTLKDKRNLQVKLALPRPRDVGNAISRWYDSDKGPDGQRGERTLEKAVGGSTDAGDRSKTAIIPIVGGGFDLTDAFMRSKGQDPYASKKLAFLDSTRDERVQLGTAHREQQLRKVAQIVQRNLDQLWQRVTDPRARREALFELWDEVAEAGEPGVVEAGLAARKLVIGVIRARLPAGGPDAYTADELAALNRRRHSKAPFAPYE